MEAFAPLLLIALILDASVESFKMVRKMIADKKPILEPIFTFGMGLILLSVTRTNLLQLSGLTGEGNLFWNVSYLTGAIILMRGSGAIHDLYKGITSFREVFKAKAAE